MPFSRKDSLGLALAAGAVVLLVAHDREPHAPKPSPTPDVVSGAPSHITESEESDVVAFVDVLLPGTAHSASRTGVVVVRRGVVSDVGSAEKVDVPAEAAVIDGDGSAYLVASASTAGSSTWTPVSEGLATELLLLTEDPRASSGSVLMVRGRLTRGHWSSDVRTARASGVPAGH